MKQLRIKIMLLMLVLFFGTTKIGAQMVTENADYGHQPAITEAVQMIRNGEAKCVLIKEDSILAVENGKGVSPLLAVYESHKKEMKNAVIVDKVIGRAAAAIAICGKVKHVYGELMSEDAVPFLKAHGITVSYSLLVPRILNRKRDGLCPLEQSVEGINNPKKAMKALKKRIEELKNGPK